jgi:glycerol kinase
MAYLLALDQGTTSSRALLFDSEKGAIVTIAQREFKQSFPRPGEVEHDPEEIWSSQLAVAVEAIAKAGLKAHDIAAIGIANQRETTVVWDRKTSRPVYPAIVWQDRRTTDVCETLRSQGLEEKFQAKTGLLLDPYFSGTKVQWILDHVPGAKERARRGELAFGTIDSWLLWKLTDGKVHCTDATNASRTLLFNIHTLQWDRELLELLQIPSSLLPEVRSSSEVYGRTAPHLFACSIPICAMVGDQQGALFGQCCFEVGQAKATYGTGCFLLMNTGSSPIASKAKLLTTVAWKLGEEITYALEGSVFMAGAAIQWLKNNLHLIQEASEIDALASSVKSTEGVYFVPAFTGLGAPYWDPRARGTIVGLSRGTERAHLARATLEAIAFSAHDVLEAMERDAGHRLIDLRVDGGVVASQFLMQFQADLLQTSVKRPKEKELTALGAVFLAGLAVGIWKDKKELEALWKVEGIFKPLQNQTEVLSQIKGWRLAVERARHWVVD